MLDKEYFTTHLFSQIEDLGAGSVTTHVYLRDRSDYTIHKIIAAHQHYVLLSVYPQKTSQSERDDRKKYMDPTGDVFYDQIAVPYSIIDYVLLTITTPKRPLQGLGR